MKKKDFRFRQRIAKVEADSLHFFSIVCLSLLVLFLIPYRAEAMNIPAASLALSDVQAAINLAQNGDTVILPAGTANWTNYCGITNKGITLQGAGATQTVITNVQISNKNTGNGCVIILVVPAKQMTRITGIGFDGNETANGILINGPEWGFFQIDQCMFSHFYATTIQPCIFSGLINSCTFVDDVMPVEVTPTSYQYDSWAQPLTLGTTNSVVTEDCIFVTYDSSWYATPLTGASFSQGNGARTVLRYNAWTNFNTNLSFYPICDAHGNMLVVSNSVTGLIPSEVVGTNTGGGRGTVQFEAYNNKFADLVNKSIRPFHLRGGTCIIFSNTYTAPANDYFEELGAYCEEEDGASAFNTLTNYPGYDQHWINFWGNTFNGLVGTNVAYYNTNPIGGDQVFIVPGLNLFFTPIPLANPAMSTYTPLVYPHPLVTAEFPTGPPQPPAPPPAPIVVAPIPAPSNLRIIPLLTAADASNVISGLQIWWTFDALNGSSVPDASGNGNSGNLVGSPFLTTGIISNCLSLSGSQYCSIATPPVTNPPMTICCWIRTTSAGSNYIAGLWHTGGGAYSSYAISINLGYLVACDWAGDSGTFASSPSKYNDGNWHHVAAVWSSSSAVTLYVDGTDVMTSSALAGPTAAMQVFTVGAANSMTPNNFFTGNVDDARLYSRALSASEVGGIYELSSIW